MKLSEWFRQLHKERGISSIADLSTDEKTFLQTKYGIYHFVDIFKCNALIKLIANGII